MNMELSKKPKSLIVIYAIILFVYILAFLIIPFNKIATSWISFAFTVIAITSSLFVYVYVFFTKETLISKIYGFPICRVVAIYTLAQLVFGILICIIGAIVTVPYWIALLTFIILLGAAAIGVIITDNIRDIIEEVDESIKVETRNSVRFQIGITGITDACENKDVKAELERLNELFMFSDPVTNENTKVLEESINVMLTELKELVNEGTTEDIKTSIKKITNALNERNRICKASKQ